MTAPNQVGGGSLRRHTKGWKEGCRGGGGVWQTVAAAARGRSRARPTYAHHPQRGPEQKEGRERRPQRGARARSEAANSADPRPGSGPHTRTQPDTARIYNCATGASLQPQAGASERHPGPPRSPRPIRPAHSERGDGWRGLHPSNHVAWGPDLHKNPEDEYLSRLAGRQRDRLCANGAKTRRPRDGTLLADHVGSSARFLQIDRLPPGGTSMVTLPTGDRGRTVEGIHTAHTVCIG